METTPTNKSPKYSQRRFEVAEPEKRERIKPWMAACMITTAVGIDAFQALLNLLGIGNLFSWIISPVATFLFVLWCWILGIGFSNVKRLAAMAIQALAGMIPVFNTLPELTLGIIAVVTITMAEDRGGIIGEAAGSASGSLKKVA